jgi:DNA-directed RNA polymerase subunit beta'
VVDGKDVAANDLLSSWDPHMTPLLAEQGGFVRFEDIVPDETVREEVDSVGAVRRQIISHKGDLHPQIIVCDSEGEPLSIHAVPEKAYLAVEEGEEITAGTLLARIPREIGRSEDITAGLPRVTELFEARRPKDPAVVAEISGRVELGDTKRGKRVIIVRDETGVDKEHFVPPGKRIVVNTGDWVREGQRLIEGPLVPHDILRISGPEALQHYLVSEIQKVYRSQHETIDDKHIEIIASRMLRKVQVSEDVGDTSFLPGSVVDRHQFRAENERVFSQGGKAANAENLLFGVTKAALQSESFISAASFQETTKVLTEAALSGKSDQLEGLKENVILGHMVPAGTGFHRHYSVVAQAKELFGDSGRHEN